MHRSFDVPHLGVALHGAKMKRILHNHFDRKILCLGQMQRITPHCIRALPAVPNFPRFIMCHELFLSLSQTFAVSSSSLSARSLFLSPRGVKKKHKFVRIAIKNFAVCHVTRSCALLLDCGKRHVAAVARHAANVVSKSATMSNSS